jgi:hypothetical protein
LPWYPGGGSIHGDAETPCSTVRSDGGDRLFPEEDQLLAATRAVARIGGRHQLLFNVADNHGHSVVEGDAKVARYVAASLRRVLARFREDARSNPRASSP